MLSACATPPRHDIPVPPPAEKAAPPSAKGGYYLDDGPGENPPLDLHRVPDAVPRDEPLHPYANRPYAVLGKSYVPDTARGRYKTRGVASWYGKKFHGQKTSSGELYDMYGMSAAHPTLPIPSYARVTNLNNSRSVVVRINDRGPFHAGRLIDLSFAAAHKLDMAGSGSAPVEVESLLPAVSSPGPEVRQEAKVETRVAAVEAPEENGVYLQLGAFGARDNAENFLARIKSQLAWADGMLRIFSRDGMFRVRLGPYADRDQARLAAEKIGQTLAASPVLILP